MIPLLSACGGGKGVDPVTENFGIAYVTRPVGVMTVTDTTDLVSYVAGGDLYYRDLASPGAADHNITGRVTGGQGDVRDVTVSYDGTRLLFALRLADIEGASADAQPTWNIWEYEIARDRLYRVIASDIAAGAGQDRSPQYLPDGRIVFTSTRQRQAKATLLDEGKPQFTALNERRSDPAFVLHVMEADGTNIQQISFNQSHDLDPVVLDSGEILFSRWDNMGSQNQISLYKIRPDGTGLELVYGAHSHASGYQFLRPWEMPDGRLLTLLKPFRSPGNGADLVSIDIDNFIDDNQPLPLASAAAGATAQQHVTALDVNAAATLSPGGRFSSAYPLWDGTPRVLMSWTPCRLQMNDGRVLPCTPDRLADPTALEAQPIYGLYLYNTADATQVPLLIPREDTTYTDVVATQDRQRPDVLADRMLDATLAQEGVGVLHIRSVYDFDGLFNNMGSGASSVSDMADPAATTADQRPARFLRVVKAVSIPGRDVLTVPATAFGRSSAQGMREIVAYAPIEPDGSIKIKVPANVPLAVSVLDKDGRRLTDRHQNWLQVRPGETLSCNGCHARSSTLPHGSPSGQGPALNSGAVTTGLPFPNTDPALFADMGEDMAETRTRLNATALNPSVDLVFDDVWTDAVSAGRPKDAPMAYRYGDLATPAPVSSDCQSAWNSRCRIVINYETHVHPLWARDRGADSCQSCHAPRDGMGQVQVPAGQLDLSDGASTEQPAHFTSYRELLFSDNAQEIVMGALQDRLVQATDGNGNPIYQTDANGNIVLDSLGNPIPVMTTVTVNPVLSVGGARASSRFFDLFALAGSHAGRLDPAELRLISEWLDMGAQYYNDPFAVPQG
ncbi:MAG: hypothetical protein GC138_08665 [Gammaproteobacteria bacterium]|nr:hypothetical protein [Gammaproteobacteria bacterium]